MTRSRYSTSDLTPGGVIVLILLVLLAALALSTWVLMLTIGAFHGSTGMPPRTTGFWETVPLTILVNLIISAGVSGRTKR